MAYLSLGLSLSLGRVRWPARTGAVSAGAKVHRWRTFVSGSVRVAICAHLCEHRPPRKHARGSLKKESKRPCLLAAVHTRAGPKRSYSPLHLQLPRLHPGIRVPCARLRPVGGDQGRGRGVSGYVQCLGSSSGSLIEMEVEIEPVAVGHPPAVVGPHRRRLAVTDGGWQYRTAVGCNGRRLAVTDGGWPGTDPRIWRAVHKQKGRGGFRCA